MKSILSFLLLCFFAGSVSAQVTTSARAGASFSSLYFKTENPNQGRILGYAGLSVKVDLENQLYLQPELLYSIRGYTFPVTAWNTKTRMTYGYITIPLLAGYNLSKKFSILAGPELGYMVRARASGGGAASDALPFVDRRFNVDANAGASYKITDQLSVEARFSFGVTAIYRGLFLDENGNLTGQTRDGFHRVLQVGLSLAL